MYLVIQERGNFFSKLSFIKANQQREETNFRRYFCVTPIYDQEVKILKIQELPENLQIYRLTTDFAATMGEITLNHAVTSKLLLQGIREGNHQKLLVLKT